MYLRFKPLREVLESDLQDLIENKINENQFIDYKRDLYSPNDKGKRELIKDVVAFANTSGGLLIAGVDEERGTDGQPTGIPSKLVGVEIENQDALIRKYERTLISTISPRLEVEIEAIKLSTGKCALVFRIPNTTQKPHMGRYNGGTYLFARAGRQKYEMDIDHIKQLARTSELMVDEATQRLRKGLDKLGRCAERETSVLVFGIMPIFFKNFSISIKRNDVRDAMASFDISDRDNPQPSYSTRYTHEGLKRPSSANDGIWLAREGMIRMRHGFTVQNTSQKFHLKGQLETREAFRFSACDVEQCLYNFLLRAQHYYTTF